MLRTSNSPDLRSELNTFLDKPPTAATNGSERLLFTISFEWFNWLFHVDFPSLIEPTSYSLKGKKAQLEIWRLQWNMFRRQEYFYDWEKAEPGFFLLANALRLLGKLLFQRACAMGDTLWSFERLKHSREKLPIHKSTSDSSFSAC